MSEESTVSTTPGLIDVANVSQDFHTSNEQNDNDVLSRVKQRGVNSYVTQEIFSIELQVPFQKKKKQLVVCGHTEKVDKIMAVVLQTWYQWTVGRC